MDHDPKTASTVRGRHFEDVVVLLPEVEQVRSVRISEGVQIERDSRRVGSDRFFSAAASDGKLRIIISAHVPMTRSIAALVKFYDPENARSIRYAQAFEICEYGRQPSQDELKAIFPV